MTSFNLKVGSIPANCPHFSLCLYLLLVLLFLGRCLGIANGYNVQET